MFEAIGAYVVLQAKKKATKKAAKWGLALLPILVILTVFGSVFTTTMLMASQGGVATAAPQMGTAGSTGGCQVATPAASMHTSLDATQLANAAVIIAVGKQLSISPLGWAVAIATAMQESTLRALHRGDRDSLGLFQQRTSWGSVAQREDPATSAHLFYAALQAVPGWASMPLTVAAQTVQVSAFPDAYAQWEPMARQLAGDPAMASASCTAPAAGGNPVVSAATSQLGVPYSWGGGGPTGPTLGIAQGAGTVGFDCSGLTQYAWAKAGKSLPRTTNEQAAATTHLPSGAHLQAGDLIFFGSPGNLDHVGIADGSGGMIHAPHTGTVVKVVPNVMGNPYYAAHFALATRP